MGQAITFVLGVFAVGHFVVVNIATGDWLWLFLGLMFFPVVAVLWPFVAWGFGLLGGGLMIIYYVLIGVAIAVTAKEHQAAETYY